MNTYKHKYINTLSVIFFLFLTPFSLVSAQDNKNVDYSYNPASKKDFSIVPKCTSDRKIKLQNGQTVTVEDECDFDDLLVLVRNIMAFMLWLSASLATLSFAYAGFLYLTAFGEMGKIEQAHSIFSKVVMGFIFVFTGWLIVGTILKVLGVEDAFNLIDLRGFRL